MRTRDQIYIKPPEYTIIPNPILDRLGMFGNMELRVLLAICRKTFGWHKNWDRISLTQLQQLTGMSRTGVVRGLKDAMLHGAIRRKKIKNGFTYSIRFRDSPSKPGLPEVGNDVYQNKRTGKRRLPKLVNDVYTQKKRKTLEEDKERERRHPSMPPKRRELDEPLQPSFSGEFIERMKGKTR